MHRSSRSFKALGNVTKAASLGLILTGCTSTEISEAPRTGIDQLLFSTATDEALATVEIPEVANQTVYVDDRYLDTYDQPYVLGTIRALLNENGALLREEREAADIIVEARSGALGADRAESLLGIPSIPLIIPGAGTFRTPELSLYSSKKSDAVAKLALLAYRRDGAHLFSTESIVGKSHFHQYKVLLLINLNFTNIPEREDY